MCLNFSVEIPGKNAIVDLFVLSPFTVIIASSDIESTVATISYATFLL